MSNVLPIEKQQNGPSGARFTVQAVIEGFPLTIEIQGTAEALKTAIDRLKALGAVPPVASQQTTAAQASGSIEAPKCKYHGAMKASSRGGFYCPRKMQDGSGYCQE